MRQHASSSPYKMEQQSDGCGDEQNVTRPACRQPYRNTDAAASSAREPTERKPMRALGRACFLGFLVAACHGHDLSTGFDGSAVRRVDLAARSNVDAAVVNSPQQSAVCLKQCLHQKKPRMPRSMCEIACDPRPAGPGIGLAPYGAANGR